MGSLKAKTILLSVLMAIFLLTFFSYRLADTPDGINVDEAAYGYNGVLFINTLRDQNGRFLPLFILGSHGYAWYPPYLQYLIAGSFKILGPSVFSIRFPNVIISTISAFLVFYLAKLLFGQRSAFIALFAFLITPEVLIETHTGLEHMIVVPFVLVWLISLLKYKLSLSKKYLVIAALTLGSSFYSYAGIRPFVVVWFFISIGYIAFLNFHRYKKIFNDWTIFTVTVLPFFAIIPFLETHYSGAVLNHQTFQINSIYNFIYYYIASFDLSFLFISGDKLLIQSTGRHGMFLVTTLPVLFLGIYQAVKNKTDYLGLLVVTFFLTPIFYGFVGSVFFAHRLMYMIPLYCLFFSLGILEIWKNKYVWARFFTLIWVLLILINFFDFWQYYMFDYPKDTYNIFYHLEGTKKPYQALYQSAKDGGLVPYLSGRVARADGINISDTELFSRAIYFPKLPRVLEKDDDLPNNGVLLTEKDYVPNLKRLDYPSLPYYLYTRIK